MTKQRNFFNHSVSGFLFLFSSAYLYFFVRVLNRIGDEGALVYNAQRVIEGALPSRDFVEIMGPASFYWLGLFFKLFGVHVYVARGLLMLTGSLITVLLYWMTKRIYDGPFTVLPCIFYLFISIPLWSGTNHHWDSNLFALLSIGAFFLWQDRKQIYLLVLSGILAGLTSCFLQQKGLLIVLSLAFLLCGLGFSKNSPYYQTKKQIVLQLGTLMGSYGVVGCLVLLFYYLSGSLTGLLHANLVAPLTGYIDLNSVPYGFYLFNFFLISYSDAFQHILPFPLDRMLSVLIVFPLMLIYWLPALLLCLAGMIWFQKSEENINFYWKILPYLVTGAALWLSELHRKDLFHLIYGAPVLLILLFVLWTYCFRSKYNLQFFGICFVLLTVILFGYFNIRSSASADHPIATRRGTLYAHQEDLALKFLMDNTVPGDYVFVYPYYPMYYFLADIRNPTRYSVTYYCSIGQADEMIRDFQNKPVKYVLWDKVISGKKFKTWFPQYDQPSDGDLRLEQYILDHYQVIATGNGFDILKRQDEPNPR